MNGHQLKSAGIAKPIAHNPLTTERVLDAISTMRRCRLRINSSIIGVKWDEVFTVEQLLVDIQSLCHLPIPTSLNGSIGKLARDRRLIVETGKWIPAKRDERHCNRVPECTWTVDEQ